jgi:hypothetical protein
MKIKSISEEDKKFYQNFYKEHTVIGLMEEETVTRIIVRMKRGFKGWTPSGCARDCGDHYIVARYCQYDRVDKDTMNVTKDVEDK